MPDRLACLVPFCRRTVPAGRYPAGWEIVCGPHWRAVPHALKVCYRRARAAERTAEHADAAALARLEAEAEAVTTVFWPEVHAAELARLRTIDRVVKASARSRRLWRVCRRKAIEAAGGVG